MNTQEPVTVVLRRRVKPGAEAAFEQATRQFIQFALSFPGNRGIDVLRPQPCPARVEIREVVNEGVLARAPIQGVG